MPFISNSVKSNESNSKRLESLQKTRDEYNLKRKLVSTSLKDLDTKTVKNKKIIFDDDDQDDADEIGSNVNQFSQNESFNSTQLKELKKDNQIKDNNGPKKLLISSGEESESDLEENTKKMFETKLNLKEKEANQLIYLKSKYSNEDSRFKIDERFIESSENDSDSSDSDDEENEIIAKKQNDQDDEDEDDDGEKEPIQNVIGKKNIKNENIRSLKILEEITGKTIKPQTLTKTKNNDMEKSQLKISNKPEKIVRYDPTKEEHKKFEINKNQDDQSSDNSSSDEKTNKKKNDKISDIVEDKALFYEVDPNLKNLFSSNDIFKFKFTNDSEEKNKKMQDKFGKSIELKPNVFKFTELNNRFNSSSDEDDDEELEEMQENGQELDHLGKEDINNISDLDEINYDRKIKIENSSNTKNKFNDKTKQRNSMIEEFLPLKLNESPIGKEILCYFKRQTNDLDELRKEWSSKRELLVQEYKKKHKRVLRIQKNKNNESLLSWKNSVKKT